MDKRLEIDANNISRTVEALLAEIEEFEEREGEYDYKIAGLENEIRELQDEIAELKEVNKELQDKLDNVQ